MSSRLRVLTMTIAVDMLVACGSTVGARDGGAADGKATDGDGGSEIVCPVSDSGRFAETPSGACVGTGSCAIELDNVCRPGIVAVPAEAPVFECQCASHQWQCVVTSGGLGVIPCGDAGAPDSG
jgi:hypothetical protein